MDNVNIVVENSFESKTIPSLIPIAYQTLLLLNRGNAELRRGEEPGPPNLKGKYNPVKRTIPVSEKMTLTIKEAAEYSNIGINKLEELLRSPRCPFVLYVGKKKLVKRKEFEKYIADMVEI